MDAEREVDRLFELDPADFVTARDDLARRLRAAGDRDAARTVAGLRRPSVAAWVVNQLVRRQGDRFATLLDAGGALEQAQRRVLSGLGSGPLREASARRRAVLDEFRREAARLLRDAGRGEGHVDAAVATLEAASVEPDAARAVRRARLERELPAPSGFGGLGGLTVVREGEPAAAPQAPDEPQAPAADPEPSPDAGEEGRQAAERQEEAQHQQAAEQRRREEATAEDRRREAEERRREAAEERRREAAERLDAATKAVRDAGREARRADRDRAAADHEAVQLERSARAARREADRAADRAAKATAALERARRKAERLQDELEAATAAIGEDSPAGN